MAKIIASLLAGISVFLAPFNHYFIRCDAIVIKENDGIYYKYQEVYQLTYQDIIIYEDEEMNDLSFCLVNNYIYVLFKDDNYYTLDKYTLSGNKVKSISITNVYPSLKIKAFNNQLLIYGGIDIDLLIDIASCDDNHLTSYDLVLLDLVKEIDHMLVDGFMGNLNDDLEITSINIYKGYEDELISEVFIFNNEMYLSGKKGINSSGIYGNGGGEYYLLRLEEDIKFRQIFKNEIEQVKMIDDQIYLSTSKEVYLFACDNSLILGLNLGLKSNFIYLCNNYMCFAICQNKGYLVNVLTNTILYECDLSGYDFYGCSDYLYFLKEEKGYVLDIIDLGEYLKIVYPKYYNQTESLGGLYGRYSLSDISYDYYFEKIIFGQYEAVYHYQCNDLKVDLDGKVIVLEEENVIDGMIYPLGYHLFFNGVGYLNETLIYQNHEISAPGDYTLRLEGINKVKEIKFKVEEAQVGFSDYLLLDYDLYTPIESTIKVKIDCLDETSQVLVNEEYFDVYQEGEEYYIYLDIKKADNGFLIKRGYNQDGSTYPINYFIRILGLEEASLSLSENIIKENEEVGIEVNIYQGAEALRCLILEVDGNSYFYSLGEAIIKLDEVYDNEPFTLYFGVSNGSKVFDKVKLFSGIINDGSEILEVKIVQKGEAIETMRFNLNNKGVKVIDSGDYYLELSESHDHKIIILSIIIGIISFSLIMMIRYKRRFKKIK